MVPLVLVVMPGGVFRCGSAGAAALGPGGGGGGWRGRGPGSSGVFSAGWLEWSRVVPLVLGVMPGGVSRLSSAGAALGRSLGCVSLVRSSPSRCWRTVAASGWSLIGLLGVGVGVLGVGGGVASDAFGVWCVRVP